MTLRPSEFASNMSVESAFSVLAVAKRLKAAGKDVIELEIGDSPFPSTPHAKAAGIRAIEENFGGNYAPSPGAVYPTLTLLEEQDYIAAEIQSGTKKLYQVTDAGRQFLDENSIALKGIQARMDLAAQAFAMHSTPESVREAIRTLKQSLHMRRGPWSQEEAERVRKLIEATARQIVGGSEN